MKKVMVGEIRAVEKSHLADWAYFAHLAWKIEKKKLLAAFSEGKFPNEFLYYLEGEAVAWISLSMRSEYVEGAEQLPIAYIEGIAVAPTCFSKKWYCYSASRVCTVVGDRKRSISASFRL